jgi:multiple sugar transport system substrate-binding protein
MPKSSHRAALSHRRGLTVAVAAALGLAACTSGGSTGDKSPAGTASNVSQADIDKAMQTPTQLTYWSWVPSLDKEVALFHQKYPAITVKVVNAGQGPTQYTKLRTALKAGSGAPDAVQIEYQYIPSFTLTDSLRDLSPYGVDEVKDKFVGWTWSQVSGPKGQVYAIPQDTGPMGLLYRQDILDKYKIAVPTTWDEFAAAARKLHAADPKIYLTDLASNDNGAWMGLLWQAKAKPFSSTARDQVTVNVADSTSLKVASYWQSLVKDGVVATDPDFTDQWFKALNEGRYATWLTAAWGPLFLSGSAKATSGKWRAAPLPQWQTGETASGNWGGSTTAVIKSTKNPIAAAKFAEFLNSDPQSAAMLASQQFLFPATKALLSDPAFAGQTSAFYGGQKVNQVFAGISASVATDFQWPPFLEQVVDDWNQTVGKSLAQKGDVVGSLNQWQSRTTTYAKGQGFTVGSP